MPRKAVKIGGLQFSAQKDALEYFRKMLNRYVPGQTVGHAEHQELSDLIALHQDAATKIGVGIDHFRVMSADYGTQCFEVVRIDGTSEDFSYVRCITQRW